MESYSSNSSTASTTTTPSSSINKYEKIHENLELFIDIISNLPLTEKGKSIAEQKFSEIIESDDISEIDNLFDIIIKMLVNDVDGGEDITVITSRSMNDDRATEVETSVVKEQTKAVASAENTYDIHININLNIRLQMSFINDLKATLEMLNSFFQTIKDAYQNYHK